MFSLINFDKPIKIKIEPKFSHLAIYCHPNRGPSFGSNDMRIHDNSNINNRSYSNLGKIYKHPQYKYRSIEAQHFLAGSRQFKLSEIEVYAKE